MDPKLSTSHDKHVKLLIENMDTFLKELTLSGYAVELPKVDWRYDNIVTIRDGDIFIGVAKARGGEDGYRVRWSRLGDVGMQMTPCEDMEEVRERIGELVRGEHG